CWAAMASVVACSDRSTASKAAGDFGGTVIIVEPGAEPTPLFPPFSDDGISLMIVDQLYDRLATISDNLNTVGDAGFTPRLATSWDWARDSLSIAFHIDPRARWHDGKPVRANDVRFSYRLFADPKVGATTEIPNIDS